jgi:hypothetical protein
MYWLCLYRDVQAEKKQLNGNNEKNNQPEDCWELITPQETLCLGKVAKYANV